jgi:hypothetical protein
LTPTLIDRRSHQKKKTWKTCSHGRVLRINKPINQPPLSKHRQGHHSSPSDVFRHI